MFNKFTFFLIPLSLVFILSCFILFPAQSKVFSHKVKFYDEILFINSVNKVKQTKKPEYLIKGGIIPHHLVASFMIADFFHKLSQQKPSILILLGPNHFEKGDYKALSSLYDWETSHGIVESDKKTINGLISHKLVKIDEGVLSNDHALSALMPFIKYYMPNAKVVPILLKRAFSQEESKLLAKNISNLVKDDMVVVASVDFSHYLNNLKAQEKDEITLKIIKNFDYQNLYPLNTDYLDSPASIGTLLMIMQNTGHTNSELYHHTNSGEMEKNNTIETTSYFSIGFY